MNSKIQQASALLTKMEYLTCGRAASNIPAVYSGFWADGKNLIQQSAAGSSPQPCAASLCRDTLEKAMAWIHGKVREKPSGAGCRRVELTSAQDSSHRAQNQCLEYQKNNFALPRLQNPVTSWSSHSVHHCCNIRV